MNCVRMWPSACVVKGLPNASDYVYKNRVKLLEEKRHRLLSTETEKLLREQMQEDDVNTESGFDEKFCEVQ
jgi:hypothetical protein